MFVRRQSDVRHEEGQSAVVFGAIGAGSSPRKQAGIALPPAAWPTVSIRILRRALASYVSYQTNKIQQTSSQNRCRPPSSRPQSSGSKANHRKVNRRSMNISTAQTTLHSESKHLHHAGSESRLTRGGVLIVALTGKGPSEVTVSET